MSYFLKLFTGNPLMMLWIALAIAAASGAAGAAGGWSVNGWRLGAKVENLQGVIDTQKQSLETMEGANKRCTAGVADVKGAVKALVDEGNARTEAAAKAMQRAADAAKGHLADAKAALNRPMPSAGKECDTAAAEAAAYAKKRRAAP